MPPAPAHTKQVPQRSLFRYPGGKSRLITHTRRWLRSGPPCLTLVEPFAGGAAIALTAVAENLAETAVLIELDPEIAHVWRMALTAPAALAERIARFTLTKNLENLQDTHGLSDPDRAVRTLVLNRTRYNGIMAKRAGPGNLHRWYPATLVRRLENIGAIADRIRLVEGDGLTALSAYAENRMTRFFVDPPYERGTDAPLYRQAGINNAHVFQKLSEMKNDFTMTYGDCGPIRDLVQKHGFTALTVNLQNGTNRPQRELLITRRQIFR